MFPQLGVASCYAELEASICAYNSEQTNEVWAKRNANPSIKLKACEKNQLIWEFRNDSLTE
jgi:hypothetical protein